MKLKDLVWAVCTLFAFWLVASQTIEDVQDIYRRLCIANLVASGKPRVLGGTVSWLITTMDKSITCPLFENGSEPYSVALSPDGEHLVFSRRTPHPEFWAPVDLYMTNVDGSNRRKLTNGDVYDMYIQSTWSPDGSTIAFTYTLSHSERAGIGIMNADGSNLRMIAGNYSNTPQWSLDGKYIQFRSARRKYPNYEPFIMNADGSNQHPIKYGPFTPDLNKALF
jgi:dipeptidyl aminopeptidase/acylaminoacyl peptidase